MVPFLSYSIVAVAFGLVLCPSWAQQELSSPLEGQAQAFVDELIEAGTTEIGDLRLLESPQDRAHVKHSVAADADQVVIGSRRSARHEFQSQTVFASPDFPRQVTDDTEALAFHEERGAMGYRDDAHYSVTVFADSLRYIKNENTRRQLERNVAPFLMRDKGVYPGGPAVEALRGGIDSVGGGGDLNALAIKRRVVRKIWEEAEKGLWLSELLVLFTLTIEPDYDQSLLAPKLEYDIAEVWGSPTVLDRIIIPAYQWAHYPGKRSEIINDTAKLIRSMHQFGGDKSADPSYFAGHCPQHVKKWHGHGFLFASYHRQHPAIDEIWQDLLLKRDHICEAE